MRNQKYNVLFVLSDKLAIIVHLENKIKDSSRKFDLNENNIDRLVSKN
jgi:hypothetical protein